MTPSDSPSRADPKHAKMKDASHIVPRKRSNISDAFRREYVSVLLTSFMVFGISYGMRNLFVSAISYWTAKSMTFLHTTIAKFASALLKDMSQFCTSRGLIESTGVFDHLGSMSLSSDNVYRSKVPRLVFPDSTLSESHGKYHVLETSPNVGTTPLSPLSSLISDNLLSASRYVPYIVSHLRLRPCGMFSTHRRTYFLPLVTSVMEPHERLRGLRGIMESPPFVVVLTSPLPSAAKQWGSGDSLSSRYVPYL